MPGRKENATKTSLSIATSVEGMLQASSTARAGESGLRDRTCFWDWVPLFYASGISCSEWCDRGTADKWTHNIFYISGVSPGPLAPGSIHLLPFSNEMAHTQKTSPWRQRSRHRRSTSSSNCIPRSFDGENWGQLPHCWSLSIWNTCFFSFPHKPSSSVGFCTLQRAKQGAPPLRMRAGLKPAHACWTEACACAG